MQKSFISSPGFTQSLSRLTEIHSMELLRRKTENKIHILPENWGWVEEFLIGSLKSPSRQTIPALPKFYRRVIVLNICASDLTKYISRAQIFAGVTRIIVLGALMITGNITRMMCQSYFWFIKPQNQAHDSDYYQWAMRLLPTLFTQSSWHNKQQLLMFPMSRCRIQDTPDPRQGRSLGSQEGNLHKTIRLRCTLHTSPDHTSPRLTSVRLWATLHSNATFPHSSARS